MSVVGLEPARLKADAFSYHYRFPLPIIKIVCGLEHPLTLSKGFRFPPSALYTFKITLAWLGIAISKKDLGFPEFDGLHP